jgi:hypothetical protein
MESDCPTEIIETPASKLIEELHAVRDSVEELYLLLDHIWRSRNELRDILKETMEEKEEIIACCHCDASPPSLAVAIKEGWTDFQYDDGPGWNYLGICPDCQAERRAAVEETTEVVEEKNMQKHLF